MGLPDSVNMIELFFEEYNDLKPWKQNYDIISTGGEGKSLTRLNR